MKRLIGIGSLFLALFVNAGIVVLLFQILPPEIQEKVFRTVEVSISDYRFPELEEDPPYVPPTEEAQNASGRVSDSPTDSTGRGTSTAGTGTGGGGASSERLFSEAMTSFSPQIMQHAVKSGPSVVDSKLAVDEIIYQMELLDGINSITAPISGKGTNAMPAGHAIAASYRGRMGKAGRYAALKKYGGNAKTEDAVEKALKFLKSQQNQNGSWGSNDSLKTGDMIALSGFALLAFLSHGETPESETYGETVRKGISFLRRQALQNGIEHAGKGFGHALLTYALAEAYAMTGELSLRKPLEERAQAMIQHQNKFGSFSEDYNNTPVETPPPSESNDPRWKEILMGEPACDLSLLGWHIQALTAIKNSGIRVEKLDEALTKALEALVRIHQARKGGFSTGINIRRFDSDPDMNPVGLLGLQLLNSGKSATAKRVLPRVLPDKDTILPKWFDESKWMVISWILLLFRQRSAVVSKQRLFRRIA